MSTVSLYPTCDDGYIGVWGVVVPSRPAGLPGVEGCADVFSMPVRASSPGWRSASVGWPPSHSSVAPRANRSAARTSARAFRGINGCLPTSVSLWWAPSVYSTVPLRPCLPAALSVSHGDRRMRGRVQLNNAPDAEGKQPLQSRKRLPRKLGQVPFVCRGASTCKAESAFGRALRDDSSYEWFPCRAGPVWIPHKIRTGSRCAHHGIERAARTL